MKLFLLLILIFGSCVCFAQKSEHEDFGPTTRLFFQKDTLKYESKVLGYFAHDSLIKDSVDHIIGYYGKSKILRQRDNKFSILLDDDSKFLAIYILLSKAETDIQLQEWKDNATAYISKHPDFERSNLR